MDDLKSRYLKGIVGALSGNPIEVKKYEEELILFGVGLHTILHTEEMQKFIRSCNDLFKRAEEVDWGSRLAKLTTREILELGSSIRPGIMYACGNVDGSHFPIVPGASLGDNRLFLIFGVAMMNPTDPLQGVMELAITVRSQEAATKELQRRAAHMKPYADRFLGLLFFVDEVAAQEYPPLLQDLIKGRWEVPEGEEVASITGEVIAEFLNKFRDLDVKDVIVSALEGDIRWLPRHLKNRLRSEHRKGTAKKRDPRSSGQVGQGLQECRFVPLEEAVDQPTREQPTPEQEAEMERRIRGSEKELRKMGLGPMVCAILVEFLRGATQAEVAKKVGCTERTIRNYVTELRRQRDRVRRLLLDAE